MQVEVVASQQSGISLQEDPENQASVIGTRKEASPYSCPRPSWKTLPLLIAQWSSFTVLLLEFITGGVVDIIATIVATCVLALVILRAAPPLLESIASFIIGATGVALHRGCGAALCILAQIAFNCLWIAAVVRVVFLCREKGWRRLKTADSLVVTGLPIVVPAVEKARSTVWGSALIRLAKCTTCFMLALCLLFSFGVTILFAVTEDLAAVQSYEPEDVIPANARAKGLEVAMEPGTDSNMDLGGMPVDLTGLWWIRWYSPPIPLYDQMHLEELVSFAGARVTPFNETELYPAKMAAPTGMARHWGFSNSIAGRIAMMVAGTKRPSSRMHLHFLSDRDVIIGNIETSVWEMNMINPDEWLRTIKTGFEYSDWHYTLTRILNGDGTPHPRFFAAWADNMGGTKLRVYTSSSLECRRCGAFPFGTSASCGDVCSEP